MQHAPAARVVVRFAVAGDALRRGTHEVRGLARRIFDPGGGGGGGSERISTARKDSREIKRTVNARAASGLLEFLPPPPLPLPLPPLARSFPDKR